VTCRNVEGRGVLLHDTPQHDTSQKIKKFIKKFGEVTGKYPGRLTDNLVRNWESATEAGYSEEQMLLALENFLKRGTYENSSFEPNPTFILRLDVLAEYTKATNNTKPYTYESKKGNSDGFSYASA